MKLPFSEYILELGALLVVVVGVVVGCLLVHIFEVEKLLLWMPMF